MKAQSFQGFPAICALIRTPCGKRGANRSRIPYVSVLGAISPHVAAPKNVEGRRKLANALARGRGVVAAAREAGWPHQSASRLLRDPEFQAQVEERRAELGPEAGAPADDVAELLQELELEALEVCRRGMAGGKQAPGKEQRAWAQVVLALADRRRGVRPAEPRRGAPAAAAPAKGGAGWLRGRSGT